MYQLPWTDDMLDTLGWGQCFFALDVASRYWRMQMKEEDEPTL